MVLKKKSRHEGGWGVINLSFSQVLTLFTSVILPLGILIITSVKESSLNRQNHNLQIELDAARRDAEARTETERYNRSRDEAIAAERQLAVSAFIAAVAKYYESKTETCRGDVRNSGLLLSLFNLKPLFEITRVVSPDFQYDVIKQTIGNALTCLEFEGPGTNENLERDLEEIIGHINQKRSVE